MTPDPIAEERSRRLRAAFLNHDFGDAGKVLESAEFGNVVEDKQTFLMSSAVAGWAGSALGRRVNPASPDWQGIKDGIARGYFKNQAASNVSDQDLFSMIAADYQAQDKIAQMARQAASRGESWLGKFRELEGAEAGNILPGRLPNYLGLARAAHDEMRDKVAPYRQTINTVAEMARNIDTDPDGADWGKMAAELVKVPKQDRSYVLEALSLQSPTANKPEEMERVKLSFLRGMERFLDTAATGSYEVLQSAGQYSEIPLAPETPEEAATRKQRESEAADYRDLRDDMRKIATGNLAPLEAVRVAGMNIAGAAEMVPMTLGAFVPYVGPAAILGSIQRETYNQLRDANPTMSREDAQSIATIAAPFQAITEVVSDRLLLGRLPNLKRAFSLPVFSAAGLAGQMSGRVALGAGVEMTEELVQGITPLAIQSTMAALEKDVPNADWKSFFGDFAQNAPELLSQVLPLALVGAGVGQLSDYRAGKALARSPDLLVAARYTPEQAAQISEAANKGDWATAESVMRTSWAEINAKAASPAEVAANAQARVAAAERIKAIQNEQAKTQAMADTEGADYVSQVVRTPSGWEIRTGDGQVIPASSLEAAQRINTDLKQTASVEEAEALVQVIDDWHLTKAAEQAETKLTGETVTGTSAGVFGLRDGKTRAFDAKALETIRQQAENIGIATDTQDVFAHVNGANEVYPSRVAKDAKEIVKRLNLFQSQKGGQPQVITFLHESIESSFQLGMAKGVFNEADTRKAFAALAPALDPKRAKTDEERRLFEHVIQLARGEGDATMLRETVSELAVRDVLGRDRKNQRTGLRSGSISRAIEAAVMGAKTAQEATIYKRFRAMLKAFSAYLKGVLATVNAINQGKAKGTIGEDWNAFVDKVLGLDEVTELEKQAIQEAQEITAAGNMAFSTSRAVPDKVSKVTQMPDGAQLVGPATFSITAYHGTPHKVDKFRLANIGTGEGAQAYGWGLYFAQSKNTAEYYRDALIGSLFPPRPQAFTASGIAYAKENNLFYKGDGQEISKSEFAEAFQKAQTEYEERKLLGNLYTVELLPDEDEFLDWDKPLSEQSEKVKAALAKVLPAGYESEKGEGVYNIITRYSPKHGRVSPEYGSSKLASLGIPGIKYLDGGSRVKGDGTRNYVIFDENLVRILEENGEPMPAQTFSVSPITPEMDREYLAAVEAGDMEKAQRMVDDAAKMAGYDSPKVYHGTNQEFDTFDPSRRTAGTADYAEGFIFFSDAESVADEYSQMGSPAYREALADVGRAEREYENIVSRYLLSRNSSHVQDPSYERYRYHLNGFNKGLDNGTITRAEYDAFDKAGSAVYDARQRIQDTENTPYEPRIQTAYLKLENPVVGEGNESGGFLAGWDVINTELAKEAKETGADGFIARNVIDSPFDSGTQSTVYAVRSPQQIKSADPVTRDASGNVIPLSKRFNEQSSDIRFSVSPIKSLEELSDAIQRQMSAKPEAKLRVWSQVQRNFQRLRDNWSKDRWTWKGERIRPVSEKRTVKELNKDQRDLQKRRYAELVDEGMMSLTPETLMAYDTGRHTLEDDPLIERMLGDHGKLMSKSTAESLGKDIADLYDDAVWIPPSWYAPGAGITPDVMANNLGFETASEMWAALDSSIRTVRSANDAFKKATDAVKSIERNALEQSRKEAQEWRDEADAMQAEDWNPRASLIRDLVTLEAMIATLPKEIRGQVGGFVALARKGTEKARLAELQKRVEKMGVLLEKHLKEEYGDAVDKLFDKYRPEREAGKKAKGKLDPDAQEISDAAEAAMDFTPDQTSAELAKIDTLLSAENITPEEETKLETMRELVQLMGDWKNADSSRRESAFLALRDTLEEGWAKWKLKQLQKREEREEQRKALRSATKKKGTAIERDKMQKDSAKVLGKANRWLLNLSSFSDVVHFIFGGSKEADALVSRERDASNAYEDAIQSMSELVDEFFTSLGNGVLRGEQMRFDMSQPSITVGTTEFNKRELSELQGIQALLMWQQEDGKRHMEGPRDENNQPIEGKWAYDQAWIDELTSKLSPEAMQVKQFLETLYGAEYQSLNALYRERHGVNLPRHDRYAPITVKPQQAKQGEMVDPVSGAAVSGSILTPGALRSRNRSAVAEPQFRDALATFIAHTKQMEHWKAYYDFAIDAQAVLGNREVMNAVEASAGTEGVSVLRKWVDAFAQGGTRDAAAGLEIYQGLSRLASRAAVVGLLGRFSTLLVQSTQLAAASVKMPVGAYLKRLGLLLSGNLEWSDAMNSKFIQRRIKTAPPIVQQAMRALGDAKRPNQITRAVRFLGNLLSGVDGLCTSGTYAILLDYHRTMGRKMGLEGAELEAHAHREAVTATEQVAQPVRAGTRSLAEITNTSPLAKMSWAYASEARQKMALFAWSAKQAKADPAGFVKTSFLVFVVGGLISQVLKNLWREAKGDDDEKKWSAARLTQSMFSPITGAIPGLNMLMGEGGQLSGAKYAQYAVEDLFDGDADMKDIDTILSVMGYFNDTAAGIAALSHAGYDFAQVLDNAFGEED